MIGEVNRIRDTRLESFGEKELGVYGDSGNWGKSWKTTAIII